MPNYHRAKSVDDSVCFFFMKCSLSALRECGGRGVASVHFLQLLCCSEWRFSDTRRWSQVSSSRVTETPLRAERLHLCLNLGVHVRSQITSVCEVWISTATCAVLAQKGRCHLRCFLFQRILKKTRRESADKTGPLEHKLLNIFPVLVSVFNLRIRNFSCRGFKKRIHLWTPFSLNLQW